MYGIVDNRQEHYSTGIYLPEFPKKDSNDGGTRFKYREESKTKRMQDVVMNLANLSTQKTIVTNYRIDFKVEGYVLLGETLYRIMDINSVVAYPQTARILRKPMPMQTLILNRVSNPLNKKI